MVPSVGASELLLSLPGSTGNGKTAVSRPSVPTTLILDRVTIKQKGRLTSVIDQDMRKRAAVNV